MGLVRTAGRGLARFLLFVHYRVLIPVANMFAVAGMALLARTSTAREWNATLNGYLSRYGLTANLDTGTVSGAVVSLDFSPYPGEDDVKH